MQYQVHVGVQISSDYLFSFYYYYYLFVYLFASCIEAFLTRGAADIYHLLTFNMFVAVSSF